MATWIARREHEQKIRPDDLRTPYQKDRSRIIHAAAFRRLQAKTQIMAIGVNDFYRTRLTHSLEVAQIASGIVGQLKASKVNHEILPCRSLIETVSLAHDIGHPPFGHGGEIALNYMMREHGGFEGNAQTLRIVAKLEPYTKGFGMNLTRRTMLGFVKYPQLISNLWVKPVEDDSPFINSTTWLPAKGLYQQEKDVLDWMLAPINVHEKALFTSFDESLNGRHRTKFKSLDCSIMELADDIAYAVHDLEDAIATGTVSAQQWQAFYETEMQSNQHPWIQSNLPRLSLLFFSHDEASLKEAIGELVNVFITNVRVIKQNGFECQLLAYKISLDEGLKHLLDGLKQFVFRHVIRAPEMQQIEFKGQKLIAEIFSAFASDPMRLLPLSKQNDYQFALDNEQCGMRVISDFISAMTDEYAMKIHARLFNTQFRDLI